MLLIKDIHTLYTGGAEPEELHNVHLLLNGPTIVGIYRDDDLPDETVESIIDGSRLLVLPGFINMHHHFTQILTRNLVGAQNAGLFDWLVYHYPIWAKITSESIEAATMTAAAELLLSGCTTSVDHCYLFPRDQNELLDHEIKAAQSMGIRMVLCRGSMSLSQKDGGLPPDQVTQDIDRILAHSAQVIDQYHSAEPGSMLQIVIAPCSPFSVSRELMIESKRLARDRGVLCHTHLAETRDEEEYCLEHYGCRPLDYLEQVGWLDERTFLVHMIWINEQEIGRLATAGTGLVHCPSSNMRLGSGICPVVSYLQAGLPVGIAVDGSASNDASNMINELRQTMLLQRVKNGPTAIGARTVIDMSTTHSARILHRPDLGHLHASAAADVIGINLDRLPLAGGLSDPVAAIIFGLIERVDLTIVAGRILVNQGQLVQHDLTELIARHNQAARDLLQ
ncbi:8-oxoguanine deaminase [bacterium]|nr:8-oxoguanine deaminase [bacterium]